MAESSKGATNRRWTSSTQYRDNWERIFGRPMTVKALLDVDEAAKFMDGMTEEQKADMTRSLGIPQRFLFAKEGTSGAAENQKTCACGDSGHRDEEPCAASGGIGTDQGPDSDLPGVRGEV